jgi:tetratricopeptide (TPR) repeat protein
MNYAMSYQKRAVESTPSDHTELPGRLSGLGYSYSIRFIYAGDLQDIDYAISHHQRAVQSTPSFHTDLPHRFSNLGNAYLYRFRHTGDLQDVDHAMFYHQKAVDSGPSSHSSFPGLLHNLANSYSDRFQHTGDLQDIDHAISYHQRAVEFTPSGHVNLPMWFNSLGDSYAHRFKSTNYLPDVQQIITSYRQGAQANGAPSSRLIAARNAAMQSAAHKDSHCLADFALAISLLSEVAGLDQTIHRRYANLYRHSGLVQFAVTIALKCNRSDLALEWLEHGRCLVWNQLNQLRTPIENLHVRSPSLANHFVMVASALESYGTRSSSILSSDSTLTEHIHVQNLTRNHTALAAQYKQLLKEIHGLPDFHDFLTAPNATHLFSSLPSDGPVIIFNVDKTQCDALALIAGIDEPLHIPLENFSLVEAEKLWSRLQSILPKQREVEDRNCAGHPCVFPNLSFMFVLKELWDKVVHPVLEALGYSVSSTDY